jgi:hypothetical protein
MFYAFITVFALICTTTHAMENSKALLEKEKRIYQYVKKQSIQKLAVYHKLYSLDPIIDIAQKAHDGMLMATLMHIYFPPSENNNIIKEYIAPYFAHAIVNNYKDTIIKHACLHKPALNEISATTGWQTLHKSDGTYWAVPQTTSSYKTWVNSNFSRKRISYHNQSYITLLEHINPDCSYRVSAQEKEFNKILFSITKPEESEYFFIITPQSVMKALFNHDATLLLFFLLKGDLALYNTQTHLLDSDTFNTQNEACFHKTAILWAAFSPDNTRLVTASCPGNNTTHINIVPTCLLTKEKDGKVKIFDRDIAASIRTVFFMDNDHLVIIKKNYTLEILNAHTLEVINTHFFAWPKSCLKNKLYQQFPVSLSLQNNKNSFLVHTLDKNIAFIKDSGSRHTKLDFVPTAIALSDDGNSMMLANKEDAFYEWNLYNAKEQACIDFIQKEADLMQLYEILALYEKSNKRKQHASKDKKELSFTTLARRYITEQLFFLSTK